MLLDELSGLFTMFPDLIEPIETIAKPTNIRSDLHGANNHLTKTLICKSTEMKRRENLLVYSFRAPLIRAPLIVAQGIDVVQ